MTCPVVIDCEAPDGTAVFSVVPCDGSTARAYVASTLQEWAGDVSTLLCPPPGPTPPLFPRATCVAQEDYCVRSLDRNAVRSGDFGFDVMGDPNGTTTVTASATSPGLVIDDGGAWSVDPERMEPGTYVITGRAVSDGGSSVCAFTVTVEPTPWDYYGNPWTPGESLANISIGSANGSAQSYRFCPRDSGTMEGFQTFFIFLTSAAATGYAAGDGGEIRVRLWPDDGAGLPDETGTPLAELTHLPGLVDGRAYPLGGNPSDGHTTAFKDLYWDVAPVIDSCETYHIMFENVHADPANNFIGLNTTFGRLDRLFPVNGGACAPTVEEWGLNTKWNANGQVWAENTNREVYSSSAGHFHINMVPIMEHFGPSDYYGNSYMDIGGSVEYPVTATSRIRQVFTPTEDQEVQDLCAFVEGTGTLEAVLTSGGSVIWSGSTAVGAGWNHVGFATPALTLTAGQTYELEFRATSGSLQMDWWRSGTSGTAYTYPANTSLASAGGWDGYAQTSIDSGGTWADAFFTYADLVGVAFNKIIV